MTTVTALTQAALPQIAGRVAVPGYDRRSVRPGMVHIGVGGFHRAHQAVYLDDLMGRGRGLDWGVAGVGLLPGDAAMRDVMAAQDCLYTVVAKAPDGTWTPRVVGSMVEYLFGPDRPAAVVERMAAPETRIVSLTVTEGGYNIDQRTGEFLADAPAVRAELRPGAPLRTVYGCLCAALQLRRDRGMAPFAVVSCDNIQDNGAVARQAVTSYAALRDPGLADWIDAEVRFPSSMVDRITPMTTDADRADVSARYGVEDAWPVVTEAFTQWVLTDDFPLGRPEWEAVGVQMVADVAPYELMKLRLLNASHQGIAYLAHLAGFQFVHEAAAAPDMARFLARYMDQEAAPTLLPVPGIDLTAYRRELLARFANPEIRDQVARLAQDGSDRVPKFLVPVVLRQLELGGDVRRSAGICAAWARYCEGTDEQGCAIRIQDNNREQVMATAARQNEDPLAFLRQETFFGHLASRPEFTEPYLAALRSLHTVGATATLRALADLK
jgi:mannitol 2-dehydrogenase